MTFSWLCLPHRINPSSCSRDGSVYFYPKYVKRGWCMLPAGLWAGRTDAHRPASVCNVDHHSLTRGQHCASNRLRHTHTDTHTHARTHARTHAHTHTHTHTLSQGRGLHDAYILVPYVSNVQLLYRVAVYNYVHFHTCFDTILFQLHITVSCIIKEFAVTFSWLYLPRIITPSSCSWWLSKICNIDISVIHSLATTQLVPTGAHWLRLSTGYVCSGPWHTTPGGECHY